MLKGYRTYISGWLMAITPLLIKLGYDIDPQAMLAWYDQFGDLLITGYLIGGVAVTWFRKLA